MGKKEKDAKEPKSGSAENIKVIVRCRPLNTKEKESGYKSCVDLNIADNTVQVNHVCGEPDRWTFDAVVNNTCTQKDIFSQFIAPMVDSVLEGFNATVFAYGQSGSGKTHTMTGKLDDEDLKGIIPRTFEHVFHNIKEQQRNHPKRVFSLSCTFVELYNGKIHDLLSRGQVPLAVKENKDKTFFVQGVQQPQVKFPEDLTRHMEEGTERRRVASTDLNADSSRSHSLFTLIVDMVDSDDDGNTRSVTSKYNLVDLAGSERQSKTGAAGDTLKEGCNINLSLSALGTVIDTLVKGKGHVPFRSSPLTMLLKDSLGGSSKTVMFANIGPSEHNLSETVSTLRFADRAKQIKNKPVVNLDSKDQKIQELTDQVNELREKLKQFESVGVKQMEEELEELRERVGALEVDLDNAVKGREADAVEAQQTRDVMQTEMDSVKSQLADAETTSQTLVAEAKLYAEQLRDEKSQRVEIWTACSKHFGDDVTNVDSLLDKLRLLATGVPKDEHLKAVSELRSSTAEAMAAKEALEVELQALKSEMATVSDEADSLRKKLEKTKDRLEKEKDARKLMIHEGDLSISSPGKATEGELVRSYETQVADLKQRLIDAEAPDATSNVQQDLDSLRTHKDEEISRLRSQVQSLTSQLVDGTAEGKDNAIHAILVERDQELAHAAERISALENQLAAAHMRKPSMVFKSPDTEVLQQQLHALEAELEKTRAAAAQNESQLISQLSRLDQSETEDAEAPASDNPLATVVQLLQREKAALASDLARLSKDLRAFQQVQSAESEEKRNNLQVEIQRLQQVIAVPRGDESQEVLVLKQELVQRDEAIKQLERDAAARSTANSPHTGPSVDESEAVRRVAGEVSTKLQVAELEKSELAEQLDAAKSDAAEAAERCDAAKRDLAAHSADMANKSKELSEARVAIANLENRVAELEADRERVSSETENAAGTIDSLNGRLKERTEQMQELRKAIEDFKEVAEGHKGRADQLKKALADKQQELADRDVVQQKALAEQEAAFQRLMNRRLESAAEDHKKALAKKDDDIQAIRKKMKKLEDKVEKLKERYDSKVYEYEELLSRMEEQKFEAMKNMRDKDAVVYEEGQEKVQDALKAAKERQRRQADMFANGEVNSAISGFRGPAGSAAMVAKARNSSVTPPSEDLSRRSPRPAGYVMGRAVAQGGTPSGAGYTGYVPEQPARNNQRQMNGGFDQVPDAFLDRGEGGDIYDF
jgi:chromosome segregation ATPase